MGKRCAVIAGQPLSGRHTGGRRRLSATMTFEKLDAYRRINTCIPRTLPSTIPFTESASTSAA